MLLCSDSFIHAVVNACLSSINCYLISMLSKDRTFKMAES